MKTTTLLLIGGGAAATLLYLKGKAALADTCTSQLQLRPADAGQLPPDQAAAQCAMGIASKMSFVGIIRAGAVSFWRPLGPDDVQ